MKIALPSGVVACLLACILFTPPAHANLVFHALYDQDINGQDQTESTVTGTSQNNAAVSGGVLGGENAGSFGELNGSNQYVSYAHVTSITGSQARTTSICQYDVWRQPDRPEFRY